MDITSLLNVMPGAVAEGLIWGIMGIGVYITYKILDIADLSVDGTMGLGGAVCVMMLLGGKPMWLSLLAATLAGMLAGLATGLFHTVMGIPAILAGIITQFGLWTINLRVLDGKANVAISSRNYKLLVSSGNLKGVPFYRNTIFVVAVCVVLIIALLYWFFGTERGSAMRATGCNPNMSRAQGINTNVNKVLGLMLSNGIVAFASALLSQYKSSVDINQGRGAIVIGLAAVVIGGAIFDRLFRNFALKLLAVVFGGIIYYAVMRVVLWLKVDADLLKLLQALIVAVFLAVPYWKKKFFAKPVKKGAEPNA
ncbi:MAG: ABC transporter permease [Butyrivibrio sp.]|nr:ABC transporter permease [Butyrivibrio sp.]